MLAEILEDVRERKPVNRVAAAVIIAVWLLLAVLAAVAVLRGIP